MKKLFLSILLVVSISCLSACAGQNELIGYWLSTDGGVINFQNSDTVSVGQYNQDFTEFDTYTYKINGSTIELTQTDTQGNPLILTYDFVIEDGLLTLTHNGESYSYHGEIYMQEEIMVGLTIQNS